MKRWIDRGACLPMPTVLCILVAASLPVMFHNHARCYDRHLFQYGMNAINVNAQELVFYLWYLVFGVPFVAILAVGLFRCKLIRRAVDRLTAQLLPAAGLPATAFLVLLAMVLLFRGYVLNGAPVTDDEGTFGFIAETLLRGRLVNPVPDDAWFFQHPFTIVNEKGWFGQYPIGHPLLLALGKRLHVEVLAVPLSVGFTVLLTWLLARDIGGRRLAGLAVLLLLLSPHYVFMGASRLSQPVCMLAMTAGCLCVTRFVSRRNAAWGIAAGVAWGFGILTRPAPGGFFLMMALMWAWGAMAGRPFKTRIGLTVPQALPALLFILLLLAVNAAQTGAPLVSGYHEASPTRSLHLFQFRGGVATASVFGGLLRQNFWLFGWPISFLFLPFALPDRRAGRISLLWGMVGAGYVYRVVAPKTVVATLGPVYLTEIVPLLAVLSAWGAMQFKQRCANEWGRRSYAAGIPMVLVASAIAAGVFFLPVQIRNIHRSTTAWNRPLNMLRNRVPGPALIFANTMVAVDEGLSWAYYPPHPSVDFAEPYLFVRLPRREDWNTLCRDFWQRHFPDRAPYVLVFRDGEPQLVPLPL